MSDDRRKTNKHCTGTVPKAKYRNNTTYTVNQRDGPRSLTNNLASDVHHSDYTNFIRNPRRNSRNNYFTMDTTVEDHNQSFSSLPNTNGILTPNSSCTSRRNSSALKCDNVTKYPEKQQIEDKLSQIREYLRITTSLMATMKNTDDQSGDEAELENLTKMIRDLTDSETKLVDILNALDKEEKCGVQIIEINGGDHMSEASTSRKNEREVNLAHTRHDIDSLKEEQLVLLKLQQKAENKLKDARFAQEKLLGAHVTNDAKNVHKKDKCLTEENFDDAIKELEERAKRLNDKRPGGTTNFQDKFVADVDSLQKQIFMMHNANEERSQLIEVLDNRDAELRSQHVELQSKLMELQNKKQQVDQLVAQLQNIDDAEEDDDIGGQVRRIVTMKDQLNKLKDMLEVVKTTENAVQNCNDPQEANELACDVCDKAENFLLNDFQNIKTRPHLPNESNVLRYDNNSVNEHRQKQVNKNTRDPQTRVKPGTSSINELEAKKRELEDLMGKHKAATSNLNHDVGADTKSEFSCTNSVNEGMWIPLSQLPCHSLTSNHFSSDDCQEDVNEYSEIMDNQNHGPRQSFNCSPQNTTKHRSHNQPRVDYPSSNYESMPRFATPDRNVHSSSVGTSGCIRERPRSNTEQDGKLQVKKQLQLIKSLCESILEQQTPSTHQSNVQVRNNLTPSPLYSEPRRFASPNPNLSNSVNVANPTVEPPWTGSGVQDLNNYQGWLATNTLQTQSFMLNTLNQCCQMLWIQQRELQSLRNTVSMLQDRMDNSSNENNQQPIQLTPNQYRPTPSPKVHVATACSMPNLNHFNAPPSNLDLSYINQNNMQSSSRVLDPCLNNVNHLNTSDSPNNTVLHGVNANINQTMPGQLWNGQALNNQVAPGNRANNYWDNFRSYSRQNLLSSKNIDGLPSSLDRSNSSNERTNPFALMALSKSNSEHESTSTSQENTPQRRLPFRHNETNTSAIPPDVLNVNNHNAAKFNEQMDLTPETHQEAIDDLQLGFQMLLNTYHDESSNHSNISEERVQEPTRKRNEWVNENQNAQNTKTKLFEELRENVYKEVASLISANEARPHFLIQLFRDLQLIGSDSLRLKILQSIQSVITPSLVSNQNINRLSSESQQLNLESTTRSENFSLQSTVWSKARKNSTPRNVLNPEIENDIESALKGVMQFINDNNDTIIDHEFINMFKQKLLESKTFEEARLDSVFMKHFMNVLNELLEQFLGKKLLDVKMSLLHSIGDLLEGELSFIHLIQETSPEHCANNLNNEAGLNIHFKPPLYELQNNHSNSPQLHNGDLAEADQTRSEEDEAEEEGAVGGYLEIPQENSDFPMVQTISEEPDIASINFINNGEGLDQVPTRLPTNVRSRSTTPNRDPSRADSDNF